MPLVKLDIPAGVYSHGVDLDSKGRWLDSSLVRWTNNAPQPVGGWVQAANIETISDDPHLEDSASWTQVNTNYDADIDTIEMENVAGTASSITQSLSSVLAVSTAYVVDVNVTELSTGASATVTLGGVAASSNVESTGRSSFEITTGASLSNTNLVIELDSATGGETDTITFTEIDVRQKGRQSRGMHSWASNNGAPYLAAGSYNRLAVVDGNDVVYDVTPAAFSAGIAEASENLGYGGKNYGSGAYGVPRERNYSIAAATNWSLDNWGEDLIALSDAEGNLYELDVSAFAADPANTVATLVSANSLVSQSTEVPISNTALVVTAERFVFCLGAGGDTRKVQWCDRENLYEWQPAITNEAGDIELQTSGQIVAGARVRGRTLICTDIDAWVATYQGPPTVFGFQKIGNSCGLVGRNMLASVGPTAFWMGERNFFVYDGSTARVLPCEVHDKVFTEMNRNRVSHGFAVANQKYNEVWWFYPGVGEDENTRYVAYDYNENHWLIGELDRCSGVDSGVFVDPMWIAIDGSVYRHESGYGHEGSTVFVESGPVNIADGDNVMRITEMIPEEDTQGEVSMKFKTRFYPNGSETEHGPFDPANPTNVRMTGRQVRVRIDGDAEANWRVGDVRLRVSSGGRR